MMKLKFIALALLPLSLAACQSNDVQQLGDLAVSVLQQQNPSQTLTAYTWQLDTGATKPLSLQFAQDGRFSISTTCNTLAGGWKTESNQLKTSNLMSTQMACQADAMKQEQLAGKIFNNSTLPFVLNLNNREVPTLTLVTSTGERYVFNGKMTPETRYQGQAETIFLEVSPETKSCNGVVQQTCLQVKEIKYNEQGLKTHKDANWTLFYDQIEGFNHSPNERQVIRVKRFTVPNPAADQSKYAYVHDMTVERETVK